MEVMLLDVLLDNGRDAVVFLYTIIYLLINKNFHSIHAKFPFFM